MGRRRKVRKSPISREPVDISREPVDISREAEYIVRCAVEMRCRVVAMGPLLFFSTETGDAWVLDPADGLARYLARSGEARPLGIVESTDQFGVEWDAAYSIKGETMFVSQSQTERSILGYPVAEIQQVAARMRSGR
jgi:hypothetical protein